MSANVHKWQPRTVVAGPCRPRQHQHVPAAQPERAGRHVARVAPHEEHGVAAQGHRHDGLRHVALHVVKVPAKHVAWREGCMWQIRMPLLISCHASWRALPGVHRRAGASRLTTPPGGRVSTGAGCGTVPAHNEASQRTVWVEGSHGWAPWRPSTYTRLMHGSRQAQGRKLGSVGHISHQGAEHHGNRVCAAALPSAATWTSLTHQDLGSPSW